MRALLVAYELTRMVLIKLCKSIKSDHSHYPVHLVGLWLGSCYTPSDTHTRKYIYGKLQLNAQTFDHKRIHLLTQSKSAANTRQQKQKMHMKAKRFTCSVLGLESNRSRGQNTQTHLETIPLEPLFCCTRCFHVAKQAHRYTHTHTKACTD